MMKTPNEVPESLSVKGMSIHQKVMEMDLGMEWVEQSLAWTQRGRSFYVMVESWWKNIRDIYKNKLCWFHLFAYDLTPRGLEAGIN